MLSAAQIFGAPRALVGMIHLDALPGTPHSKRVPREIVEHAVGEARTLVDLGFDALIIENMGDRPYLMREVGPEIIATMTAALTAIRREIADVPIGVQVLAGANRAALAVAQAGGGSFIRAEGFVFASVADEGLMRDADAGALLRERKRIGAEHVAILADVKKKHASHAITADVSIAEMAVAAEFFLADGVIVTGRATAQPVDEADLETVRATTKLPIGVGSGVEPDTVERLLRSADALIVGSSLKRDGLWSNPIDPERARAIAEAAKNVR